MIQCLIMKLKIAITVVFLGLLFTLLYGFKYIFNHYVTTAPELILPTTQEWRDLAKNPAVVYRGSVQYRLRCYKCHGINGEGSYKGVSFIDDEWQYGSTYDAIYAVTYYGAGEMKGYGKKLKPSDIQALTVFIKSLAK